MTNTIDTVMLFASVTLLVFSLVLAYLVLRKTSERQRRKAQVTSEAAIRCLQQWRDSGVLMITDEDFQLALELEKNKPGQLRYLVRTIRRILKEKEYESNTALLLTVRVEHENEAESAVSQESHAGHLELITEFA